MEVIPAIDIRGGLCVRLEQGDYARETVFGDDPAAMARRWQEAGVPRIHVVDLDGAREGRPVNEEAVRSIRLKTKDTLDSLREKGIQLGKPPVGLQFDEKRTGYEPSPMGERIKRLRDTGRSIEEVIEVFEAHGLRVETGPMSTLLFGDDAALFAALHQATLAATRSGKMVMVFTVSNACEVPER